MTAPADAAEDRQATAHVRDAVGSSLPDGMALQILARAPFRVRIADDGVGLPPGADLASGTGLGSRLISHLARSLGTELVVDTGPSGTTVTLDVPRAARGSY